MNKDTGTSFVSHDRFFKDANFEGKKNVLLRLKKSFNTIKLFVYLWPR